MNEDFFILTALPEEFAPMLSDLSEIEELAHGFQRAKITNIHGVSRQVLLYPIGCGQGTNKANSITTEAILKYRPRVVLLVGIAGGFDEHGVCLGDVLVPEYIDAYELAKKSSAKPKIKRRQPPFSVTAAEVVRVAKSIMVSPQDWLLNINEQRPNNKERDLPKIHAVDRGVLGSGEKNLADQAAEEREYLKKTHENRALGFDMEAAGLAVACKEHAVPFAVIKGVQDNGTLAKDDPKTKDEWRVYAADAAAALTILIMRKCNLDDLGYTADTPDKTTLEKKINDINPHFSKKLIDAGGPFSHPRKTDLILEDIFVYPQVRDLTLKKEDKDRGIWSKPIDSDILLKIDKVKNRILLIGDEKSGKTALCKMLFKHYHNNGYVPVLIDGSSLKHTSIDEFDKIVRLSYTEQYSSDTLEAFMGLDQRKKLVIIDNFDKQKLNIKYRAVLLNNINTCYTNIILTGGDLFQIGEIVSEQQPQIALEDYKQFGILPYGNVMRNRLIDKWNRLGTEEDIEEDELIRKNDEAKRVIDAVIGKNFVPSFPIFLLTLLQAIETKQSHNLETSAYGHYYNFLITRAIGQVCRSNDKVDAYYNYLTELANYLFENRTHMISGESLRRFHEWYCREFTISSSLHEVYHLSELIRNLVNASILEKRWDGYYFAEKYIEYFFAAKYLADNITREDIKQRITQMCKRFYRDEFANIVLFLTHHSKDPFILSEILANAKSLFSECALVKLEDDASMISNLLEKLPRAVLENKGIEENRLQRDKVMDEATFVERTKFEERGVQEQEIPDVSEEIIVLDSVSQLNLAFKTIEILGQILKNYHSSLRGDPKYALAQEAYYLGLRSLSPLFTVIKENTDYIVRLIRIFIKKNKLGDKNRIQETSRRLLFTLCAMLCYGFIKKISYSIGSEHLSETFKQLKEKNDITSVHLVDVAIKLDFYKDFPYSDIKELKKRIGYNLLPYSLLRQMVFDYLYMFPTSVQERQEIAGLLGIEMAAQRLIQMKSTQVKK